MARAWSGYVDSLVGGAISNYTRDVMSGWTMGEPCWTLGTVPDVVASGLCLTYAMLLGLGVKTSTTVNSLLTIVNLAVMGLVIILGIYYADIANWGDHIGGLLPYGFSGVIMGELSQVDRLSKCDVKYVVDSCVASLIRDFVWRMHEINA